MRSRNLMESTRNAVEGLVYVLHRDWHVRFLFLLAAVLILVSAILRVTKLELLLLCVAICLVVLAELFNSAIETVVDLISPQLHPLAKRAKDVGGAAVLVAIVTGLLVLAGVFVSAGGLERLQGAGTRPAPHFLHVALAGVVTVIVAVILGKLWGGHGTLTKGGVVSAHSALGFFCLVSVWFLTQDILVTGLALVLAMLVAQSRIQAGIHTVREVLIGVAVALVVGVGIYSVLAMRAGG
jgi:diacylglycerol kinase (ATP)